MIDITFIEFYIRKKYILMKIMNTFQLKVKNINKIIKKG